MNKSTEIELRRYHSQHSVLAHGTDHVATEEPLEIRLVWKKNQLPVTSPIAVTMRTPGNDVDLALGFLFTEGIISTKKDIVETRPGQVRNRDAIENVIEVVLSDECNFDPVVLNRNFYMHSSCGVCGKASIDAVFSKDTHFARSVEALAVPAAKLALLSSIMQREQQTFTSTGGLHAVGLFSAKGDLHDVAEDVGRHNALDKLIGRIFRRNLLPLEQHIVLLSGRTSFEMVQKAHMAGVQCLASIGAPSSLAVSFATEADIALIGFLKSDRFNIYHQGRLQLI